MSFTHSAPVTAIYGRINSPIPLATRLRALQEPCVTYFSGKADKRRQRAFNDDRAGIFVDLDAGLIYWKVGGVTRGTADDIARYLLWLCSDDDDDCPSELEHLRHPSAFI